MTTQIEVEGNKIFGDINRNNVNRGNAVVKNRRAHQNTTNLFLSVKNKLTIQNG